ncbi:MAG: PAS domain-containing protein, partial [Vicinamibacterales bacterium]
GVIREERATRGQVEQALAHAEAARREAEQRHASALATAATTLAERQAQFDAERAEAVAAREGLQRELREAETALTGARQAHASAAGDVERLAHREADLVAQLTDAAATREALERRLADTTATFTAQLTDAAATRTALEGHLTDAATRRETLEQQLADTTATFTAQLTNAAKAMQEANERATRERQAADARAAAREAELTAQLTDAAATRTALEGQLTDAATRRETLERRLADTTTTFTAQLTAAAKAMQDGEERAARKQQAAAQKAAEREAALDGLIREERATRGQVEQALAHAEAALREAEQRHASALATAAATQAERQAQFDAQWTEAVATREGLQRELRETETALTGARQAHASAAADVERLAQREADLTSVLANAAATRETLERRLADTTATFTAQLTDAAATRAALEGQLTDAAKAMQEADERATRERQAADARAAAREAELGSQLTAAAATRAALEGQLIDTATAMKNADQSFREQMTAMTAGARDQAARFEDQIARARIDQESRLAAVRAEAQRNLEEARRAFQHTLDRVSSEHTAALANLVAAVRERDARIDEQAAQHSAALQAAESERAQLQAETRRRFEQAPLALCRCTRDGVLTDVNRAFADLVGCGKTDGLRGAKFGATIFESPDDLSWLIERCLSTHTTESIETAWRKTPGSRIVVRVSACASAAGAIEIVAEDLTSLRALQDRLGQAHRMEAVGRLASEVAVTCGNLLRDVHQNAQPWLTMVGSDTAVRHRGEMLFEEVTRAASFLRQLAAYGDEEASALLPVDVTRVLHDLEPVLQRVAGDDVKLELPKAKSPLNVDAKAERVERLLVNLAAYGRERMPSGGRLRIDLATIVVSAKFIAQHPNCRLGRHALITVTEIRRETNGTEPQRLLDGTIETSAERSAPERPGVVDLGALQELIGECSGHLWMTVEPSGNMVAKIFLPLRSEEGTHPGTPVGRSSRGGTMTRWLRN